MPRVLELYCGTKSWTKPYEKDSSWQIDTLDNNPKFKPTICTNILTWDYKNLEPYNVIYASPPCNLYFTPIKNLQGNKKFSENDVILSKKFVDKTIEIIQHFKPTYWVIENPVGKMRTVTDNKFSFKSANKPATYNTSAFTYSCSSTF
ncbi:MAG TPA: hypothetical protein VL945_00095 [Candidatus Saccharimonadales bacterium]|nr:hypothetical protein [Candidatus Saccharimonadales bacterium]